MELYQWQKDAIGKFYECDRKMIAVVPTGAGKTYFAIKILRMLLEEYPNMRVIIIVPKIVIVNTWLEELMAHNFYFNNIGIYKGGCKEFSKITITTTASAKNLDMKMFDFGIFDELHNFGTPIMHKIISSEFKFKLGLTATPDRSDDKHWMTFKEFDYNIYEYSIKEAVEDEILNKYDFYDVVLHLNKYDRDDYEILSVHIAAMMKRIGGYYAFLRMRNDNMLKINLMKLFDKRKKIVWHNKAKLEVVSNICKFYNEDSKIIVFSQFNSTTNALFYYLGSLGVKSSIVHSNIPIKEREEGLKNFNSGNINVLITTKVCDEGINIVKADIGIIVAGERSQRQTVQRLGRVLRKKEKKSKLFQIYFDKTFESPMAKKKSKYFRKFSEKYEKVVM